MNKFNKVTFIVALAQMSISNAVSAYTTNVGAGQVADNEVVGSPAISGEFQQVYGTVNNTEIIQGGEQHIQHGGVANATIINGGTHVVATGGISNSLSLNGGIAIIGDGGSLSVPEGTNSIANDAQVNGGTLYIRGTGVMENTIINGGAVVNESGRDYNTVVNAGGILNNNSLAGPSTGQGESYYAVVNRGGIQNVRWLSRGSVVNAGGILNVLAGPNGVGTAGETVVRGLMYNQYARDMYTVVESGGTYVSRGGESGYAVVRSGGFAVLAEDSTAYDWNVDGGATVLNSASAKISTSSVSNGGKLFLGEGLSDRTTVYSDGQFSNVSGRDVKTVLVGGQYVMGSATGALGVPVSSNLKVGQGARADIINGTVEGRTSISGVMNLGVNPQGYDPARVAALKGNVKVSDTGQLNIFYGADVKNADLDASGEITLSHQVANVDNRYDYHLGALKNSGIVKLGQSNGGYSTLNLASLSGAGQFWMNTDLSTLQGDQIRVEGETQGSHTLVVADSGYEPQAAGGRLTLVSGSGGAGTFVLMGDHVDAGAFRYVLSKEGQDWVLANSAVPINPIAPVVPVTPKPENLSKGANAATATQTARAALWNAETGTLVQRLGDLRLGHDEGGVWMRNMDSRYKFDTSTSRAFDQNIHGMQIGADKALSVESGKVYVGSFIGVGQARQSLGEGAKSQIDSKSVGAYATYLDDNGIYVDTVAKFSRYDTDMRSTSNLGDKVHGSFDSNAYGVSVEVGKRFNLDRGWFVEPQVQLSSGRLQGGRYTSTDGLQVKADAIDTLQSRVGGLLGNTIQLNDGMAVRPYIKASWITEHRGDSQVRVNNVKLSSDLPGDHGEVGLGAVLQLNSQHNLSVDAEYGNGNGIEQPWVVNIGYRFAL